MVTDIEDISKAIQKYRTKQPSTEGIGSDTTTSTIFKHAEFTNDVKDRYLDKGNPQILMTGYKMKYFNTGIPDPLYPTGNTTTTQEYHLEPPVTGDRLFTRDGTYLKYIKQDSARYICFVSTMTSCHGSSPTAIIIWYQYVTIHYAIHGIYLHPHYCFIYETNNSKGFSN